MQEYVLLQLSIWQIGAFDDGMFVGLA